MKEIKEIGIISILALIFITTMVIDACTDRKSKYTIYAGDMTYHCNDFTISGKTIYFNDVDGDSVFINGQYTLVYEKEVSKE